MNMQHVSWTKNQHTASFMNKISFVKREKINSLISRREKSTCNMFQKQNQARSKFHRQKNQPATISMYKTRFTRRKITVKVKRRDKIYLQQVSWTKIRTQQVPRMKEISTQWVPRTKPASWGEKSKYKFQKRKINIQQASRIKIRTQQVAWTKNKHTTSYTSKISLTRKK